MTEDREEITRRMVAGRRGRHRVTGRASTLLVLGLSLALVVSIAWGIGQYRMRLVRELHLELARERSFEQLLSRTETVELLLAKSLVTQAGCAGTMVFVDLWHEGLAAQEDLTNLPLTHFNIANPSRFMTQVADFGRTMARKCTQGESITDEDWNYLSMLHAAAGELALQLHELARIIDAGGFRWALLGGFGIDATAGAEPGGGFGFGIRRQDGQGQAVEDGFGQMAAHIQDLPVLIYDGPFSDHMENRTPRALPEEEITVEQAMEIARRFAPELPGAIQTNYQVIHVADVPGRLASYALALRPEVAPAPGRTTVTGSGTEADVVPEIRMDVTKRGGQVLWFLVQGLPVEPPTPPVNPYQAPDPDPAPGPGPGEVPGPGPAPMPEPWPPQDGQPPGAPPALDDVGGAVLPAQTPGNPAGEEQGPTLGDDDRMPMAQSELVRSVEEARRFLVSRGFEDIASTYSVREDGVAVCQFAAVQDGVLLYPDLLQVKVRVFDGQILGFDSTDYLMSHGPRDLPQPVLSVEEARAKISPRVTLVGERLVLIPTPSAAELLCYEFHIELRQDPYLVYINALNGEEEVILKLLDMGDGGALVM